MKKLVTVAVAIALAASAGTAMAQDQYDVGLFADPTGTISTVSPTINVPFTINAVGFGLDGEVKAFEVSINGLVGTPSFVIGTLFAGPAPLNVGDPSGPNYIVGTGGCIPGDAALNMISLTVLPIGIFALDTAICVGGTVPSSFGGPPGYAKCNDDIVAFGVAQNGGDVYPDGCMIINATDPGAVVPTESVSFGDMKARF